jgi:MFS family permease
LPGLAARASFSVSSPSWLPLLLLINAQVSPHVEFSLAILMTALLATGYLGIMMGTASLGFVCGPIFGGLLTERVSWRWCFYLNLPVGGVTGTLLAFMKIPDSKQANADLATRERQVKRLDLPGFALFTPTIIMLLLALERGGVTYRWNSSIIIGLFCGAGVAWILFLLWEWKQGEGVSVLFSQQPLFLFSPWA